MSGFEPEEAAGAANFRINTSEKIQKHQQKSLRNGLSDYSEKDRPWDKHRAESDDVAAMYSSERVLKRYAKRIDECSTVLQFGWADNRHTGESQLRLAETHFCRVRYCPTCQWRRSLMWQARFFQSLPKIAEEYPRQRWIQLTLTIKNCDVKDLRSTLQDMNKGWQRLIKRREFRSVTGWTRSTEVTRGSDGSAHPHFHALLMVPPSMLSGRNYVKHLEWAELWMDCMRLDYLPSVDVKAIPAPTIKDGESPHDALVRSLKKTVSEVFKYSVKPADMFADEEWFFELTRQTHKMRFMATGGVLKNVLKVEQESDEDLALTKDSDADDADDAGSRIAFNWRDTDRRYRRFKQGDKNG